LERLRLLTKDFFRMHNSGMIACEWFEPWRFIGEIPNNEKKGCYAFLDEDDKVIYIGIGIGNSHGIYEGSGLGARLNRTWKFKNIVSGVRHYVPAKHYEHVNAIVTIGFPKEVFYLAAALEVFLISRIQPELNKIHKR